ncbi:MAG: class I SAM-dependent methyltransferase [Halioglobus sp.]|nr:class I SAM-dependent methyltransferase [Halioglobus sp.]
MSVLTDLAVAPACTDDIPHAQRLARKLGLALLERGVDAANWRSHRALLTVSGAGLALQTTGKNAPGAVQVDFGSGAMRHRRRAGANELLGRAVGIGRKAGLRVLDGTAGLGTDSFVLADLGCEVSLFERHPIVYELLAAGLALAGNSDDSWLRAAADRMRLYSGDVRQAPPECLQVDVIYLDPMFPARAKSAAVGKEMAALQWLLQADEAGAGITDLLGWALEQDVARVVLKRPAKAPLPDEPRPSHCIRGKAVRYDVYVRRGFSSA